MLADYHVHTYYSDDSECPMERMLERAVHLGMDEVAFTEHVDYGVKTEENCDYRRYFEETSRLRERYEGRVTIRTGIEFGVQTHTIPLFRKDFEQHDFDFVILSNHQVGNKEFWNQAFQKGKSQDEFQKAYYEAIREAAQNYKEYSVLGHLDMIKRYDLCGEYPDERILDIVEQIFRMIIPEGKGIEVNTSCFRYGLKDLTPSKNILKLYRSMGGEIVTIGSDAHEAAHLGTYVPEAKEILKGLGFRHFCTFDKMKPIFHNL